MKDSIRGILRTLSAKPIIGKPLRLLVAIAKLPQARDMVFELNNRMSVVNQEISAINDKINHRESTNREANHQINEVSQAIAEIHNQTSDLSKHINDITQQILDIRQQIDDIGHQINGLRHHQIVFDRDFIPGITDALEYQENLKKSLPVVLRRQERKLRELES